MRNVRNAALALVLATCAPVPAAAAGPCEIVFDARRQQWDLAACAGKTDVDINGRPTIFVDRNTQVTVTVTEINPLLYTATVGEITVEKIAVLEDLATIALGVGAPLRASIRALAVRPPDLAAPNPFDEAVFRLKTDIRLFLAEEAALIAAVQQLEFAASAVVRAPTARLAAWNRRISTLREEFENDRLLPPPQQNTQAQAEAEPLLEGAASILQAVATAKLIAQRACVAAGATCPAEPAGSFTVVRRAVAWKGSRAAAWDEFATYPLTIARQSLYENKIVTDQPEKIETTFRIGSRQGALFGAGIGLTNARLADPVFAAVADPADATRKLVTQTGSSERSAIPALLATYAFTHKTAGWPARPLLEFGTSIDTDAPGVFAGVGIGLGRYIRVAIGTSYQRVTALDGQAEDETVVADNDAIKTRDVWDTGRYWSVSFNISGLPFFKQDK